MTEINPSEYTTLTLEQLRDKMTQRQTRKTALTPDQIAANRAYAEMVFSEHARDPFRDALSELMPRNLADVPTPEDGLSWGDYRQLYRLSLTRLCQGRELIIEPISISIYTALLKWSVCEKSETVWKSEKIDLDLTKGVYIWGNVGRGKSMAVTAMKNLLDAIKFTYRKFQEVNCRDVVRSIQDDKSTKVIKTYLGGQWCFHDLGYEDVLISVILIIFFNPVHRCRC